MSKLAFEAHKVKAVKPIGNAIIVCDMSFDARITTSGIIIPGDDGKSSGIRPRWARVYALGPDHEDEEIQVGKWILVSHGRWTRGIDIEDETGKKTIRKVDPNDILLVSDELPNDDTMSDKVY
jgi:co-chaperonin GroES (HSP10)